MSSIQAYVIENKFKKKKQTLMSLFRIDVLLTYLRSFQFSDATNH